MLVQPDSEKDCLVGMNAIPKLVIQLLRANGLSVYTVQGSSTKSSVRLLQACIIPGRRGRFLDVVMEGTSKEGVPILFEPNHLALKDLGLCCSDSLLTTGPEGRLQIPIQNYIQDYGPIHEFWCFSF